MKKSPWKNNDGARGALSIIPLPVKMSTWACSPLAAKKFSPYPSPATTIALVPHPHRPVVPLYIESNGDNEVERGATALRHLAMRRSAAGVAAKRS